MKVPEQVGQENQEGRQSTQPDPFVKKHAALFGLPVCEPVHPTPAGLAAAVPDWSADPAPLVALYLRRPDAKPSAARQ